MKGITPIIGVIVLLLIVVAMAGLSYTFLFGQFTAYTSKTIQAHVVDSNRVIIKNLGTDTVRPEDLDVSSGGIDVIIINPGSIPPRESRVFDLFPYDAEENTAMRITSPTNTENFRIDTTGGIFEGLVLYHHADSDASDSSVYGNDGQLMGDAQITTNGCIGNAYLFDGNLDNVTIPYDDSLNTHKDNGVFSLFMWLWTDDGSANSRNIFTQNTDASSMFLKYGNSTRTAIDAGNQQNLVSKIMLGEWQHVGFIHNGTHYIGYMNGAINLTGSSAGHNFLSTQDNFIIGSGTWTGTPLDYIGRVDEIMLWNRVISQEEIDALVQRGIDAGCI